MLLCNLIFLSFVFCSKTMDYNWTIASQWLQILCEKYKNRNLWRREHGQGEALRLSPTVIAISYSGFLHGRSKFKSLAMLVKTQLDSGQLSFLLSIFISVICFCPYLYATMSANGFHLYSQFFENIPYTPPILISLSYQEENLAKWDKIN